MHANHANAPSRFQTPIRPSKEQWHFGGLGPGPLLCVCFFLLFFSYCGILSCVLFPGNAGPSPFERHLQPVSSRPVPACPPGKSNVWKGSVAIRSAVCPNAEFEEPDWERRGCFDRDELRWEIE
jgi:hypothetical protein